MLCFHWFFFGNRLIFDLKISDTHIKQNKNHRQKSLTLFRELADFFLESGWFCFWKSPVFSLKSADFFPKTCRLCLWKLTDFYFDLIENRVKTSDVFAWNTGCFYLKHWMFFEFCRIFRHDCIVKILKFLPQAASFFHCIMLWVLSLSLLKSVDCLKMCCLAQKKVFFPRKYWQSASADDIFSFACACF